MSHSGNGMGRGFAKSVRQRALIAGVPGTGTDRIASAPRWQVLTQNICHSQTFLATEPNLHDLKAHAGPDIKPASEAILHASQLNKRTGPHSSRRMLRSSTTS